MGTVLTYLVSHFPNNPRWAHVFWGTPVGQKESLCVLWDINTFMISSLTMCLVLFEATRVKQVPLWTRILPKDLMTREEKVWGGGGTIPRNVEGVLHSADNFDHLGWKSRAGMMMNPMMGRSTPWPRLLNHAHLLPFVWFYPHFNNVSLNLFVPLPNMAKLNPFPFSAFHHLALLIVL